VRPGGATWRSGYAAVCKTVYTSSILVVASNKINNLYTYPQVVFSTSVLRQLFCIAIMTNKSAGLPANISEFNTVAGLVFAQL
jgi:hypothetical protein